VAGYCAIKGGVRLSAKAVAMECAAAGWDPGQDPSILGSPTNLLREQCAD
jgi:hypothetical protein